MPESFAAVEVIAAKRDRQPLTLEQIEWVIDAYVRGVVADEQMAALAMAIFLNGMNRQELSWWTNAMINSGERLSFAALPYPTVDKHSTGGVGDKITLPLVPLVAVYGVRVPQMAGRGLGHTGGTLDKLESISGWCADLSLQQILRQLDEVGAVICGATPGLAPADKKLYALRDTTATVESIPLIASSIMSKKIAEGAGAVVLDVKVGSGGFMTTAESARELARTLVALGTDAGVRTTALLTSMDVPLGRTVGNALEVRESIDVLAGRGPSDVVDLTVALAEEMLRLSGISDADPAEALRDGRALGVWRRMIRAQGGDLDAPLPTAAHTNQLFCTADGYLGRLDARQVAVAAWRLGAGRARKEDAVALGAGIELHAKPGDRVSAGQTLMTLHADDPSLFERAFQALDGVTTVEAKPPATRPLILDRIDWHE